MNVQAALAKGQPVIIQVTVKHLEPRVSRGDAVTVCRVGIGEVDVDDVVYCHVNGHAGLYKVVRLRTLNNVPIIEVVDKKGVNHASDDVLGKVVSVQKAGALKEKRSELHHLFDRIKNLLP